MKSERFYQLVRAPLPSLLAYLGSPPTPSRLPSYKYIKIKKRWTPKIEQGGWKIGDFFVSVCMCYNTFIWFHLCF